MMIDEEEEEEEEEDDDDDDDDAIYIYKKQIYLHLQLGPVIFSSYIYTLA